MYNFIKYLIRRQTNILFIVSDDSYRTYIEAIHKTLGNEFTYFTNLPKLDNVSTYVDRIPKDDSKTVVIGDDNLKDSFNESHLNFCFTTNLRLMKYKCFDITVNLDISEFWVGRKTPLPYGTLPKPLCDKLAKRNNCPLWMIERDLSNIRSVAELSNITTEELFFLFLARANVSLKLETLDEATKLNKVLTKLLTKAAQTALILPMSKQDRSLISQSPDASILTEWAAERFIEGKETYAGPIIVPVYKKIHHKKYIDHKDTICWGYGTNFPEAEIKLFIRNNNLVQIDCKFCKISVGSRDTYVNGNKTRFLEKYTNPSNKAISMVLSRRI